MGAQEYDKIASGIFFPMFEVIAKNAVADTGKTSGRMLDLGCGGGHFGLSVLREASDMTGVLLDFNPAAVAIADRRATEWGLNKRAVAVVGDVHKIPLPDACVDLAISRGSVGFWADIELAFSEVLRVLAPGGRTYIGNGMGGGELSKKIYQQMKTANPDWPDCITRVSNNYRADDYRRILQGLSADFEIIDEEKGTWVIIKK